MKRFLLKLSAFTSLVLLGQVVWYGVNKPPAHPFVQRARDVVASRPEILYLGDSVITATDIFDRDLRKLNALVSEKLLPHRAEFISHPGFTAEVYAEYCHFLRKADLHPRVLVVPFNLRSISSSYLRPEFQFGKEKREIRMASSPWLEPFRIPAFVFKTFTLSPLSERDWKLTPVFDEGRQVGLVRDFSLEKTPPHDDEFLKRKFIWHYMGPLDEQHSQFQALRRLAAEVDSAKTRIISYATPIDVELGQRVVGPRFLPAVRERIRLTASVMKELGIKFYDLSEILPDNAFYIQRERTISEHLNERGRHALSAKVSELIKYELEQAPRQISSEDGLK